MSFLSFLHRSQQFCYDGFEWHCNNMVFTSFALIGYFPNLVVIETLEKRYTEEIYIRKHSEHSATSTQKKIIQTQYQTNVLFNWIDWIVFYAASAIYQPFNGGNLLFKVNAWYCLAEVGNIYICIVPLSCTSQDNLG